MFWRRSNCPTSYKIIALDAVIRSKLIYGTDAMQLNEPEFKKWKNPPSRLKNNLKMGHHIH